jgi:hypothetical protein
MLPPVKVTRYTLIATHMQACHQVRNARNLRELLDAARIEFRAYLDARWQGVEGIERFDYENETPTFGGSEPADTREVWSWDETHLIVGAGVDVWRIVPRDNQ